MALLEVRDLCVAIGSLQPLDRVAFTLDKGSILGLVGESGSGKSLTAMALMGLLPLIGGKVSQGSVRFDGTELVGLDSERYRALRGRRMALITQNPMTSLDPIQRVGTQIDQVGILHRGLSAAAARARSIDLLTQLRIPDAATVHGQYPHQMSGGMKQRVVIAMALAGDPDLIIADEPTTALDVTIQAQIIQILADLVRERGLALLLITHDMSVVAQACDQVLVLYAGRIAESNTVEAIFAQPVHPYTQALIACIPRSDQTRGSLRGIAGIVPSVASYASGCRYHPRCSAAQARCQTEAPALQASGSHRVACHFAGAGAAHD
jgi:oligopeptide/dipeptide ABC transporter ATP-binding protein